MKIFAHRGFSEAYPQNTLLAFEKALEGGVDGIETDLRLSRDGVPFVFHDDELEALTGVKGKPEDFDMQSLQSFQVDGEPIPSLDSLLRLVDGKCTLVLEIKYNPATYKALCDGINTRVKPMLSWVHVSCFDDVVLEYIHGLNPDITLHKLIDDADLLQSTDLEMRYHYATYFDIWVDLRHKIPASLSLEKVIFWTVANEDITQEDRSGLYGIMTNNPPQFL